MIGFLGLGSNVGDRRGYLRAAVEALPGEGVEVLASSSVYETEPVGDVTDQPAFLNACLRIRTEHAPLALLDACKRVEGALGRRKEARRHGPRPIDVDVLLLGDLVFASDRLVLPHPEVTARRFVLVPLLELEPGLELTDGTSLTAALDQLPQDDGWVRHAGPPLISA